MKKMSLKVFVSEITSRNYHWKPIRGNYLKNRKQQEALNH